MLTLTPINLKTANAFVQQYHRHHKPTRGHKFSIGVSENGALVGVAICGRPVARRLDDGYTLEVNRLCTNGTPNACSILYAAAYRAARAMGYNKVITYILDTENVQNPVYRAKGEIMSLTDKVSQMAKKREQLYADYVAGVVDSEDYQLIREDYSRQYDGLRAALQEAENKKTEVERQIEEYMNMTSHLEEHLDNFEFDIQLVKSLVQKIEVSADKRIRIVFGFQDVFTELGKESAET